MAGDKIELNMAGGETFVEERRCLSSSEVMLCALQELGDRARKVVDHTFERLNILDEKEKEDYHFEVKKSIVGIRYKDSKSYQNVVFNQYKVEGSEFRKLCANQAMRCAIAVLEELDRNIKVPRVYSDVLFLKQSKVSFGLMVNWLVESQRHLAALDVLENIKKETYAIRAAKGGRSRSRSASKKDQRELLNVMIKGLLYGDPKAPDRAKRYANTVADEWAEEIFELNKRFHIFDWSGLGKFREEILDLLIKNLKRGEDVSDRRMRIRLRIRRSVEKNGKSSTDESVRENIELARERGYREGIQFTLMYLLEQRFGEVPDAALDLIQSISDVSGLQACLDRLPNASSWKSVLDNDP